MLSSIACAGEKRDSRTPTSLRSPTSNAYGCRWHPRQTKMKILHTQLFVFFTSHAFKQAWAWDTKKNEPYRTRSSFCVAEREGFEPPEPLSSTVFKTAAIDHSAISPRRMNDALKDCAQDETRTHTVLRPLPPQSSVYTNFTTCARRNALVAWTTLDSVLGRPRFLLLNRTHEVRFSFMEFAIFWLRIF